MVLTRFIQFGAAAAAIVILGVLALTFLASGGRQHGSVPAAVGSPTSSPIGDSLTKGAHGGPPSGDPPICSGTYVVTGNDVAVTVVTDQSPLQLVVNVSGEPGSGVQKVITSRKGQTTVQFTFSFKPPVSLVQIFINGPHGGILRNCEATPA